MRTSLVLALTLAVGLAACERPADRNVRGTVYRALHGVLVYPRSLLVEMDAGDSAGQLTLTTVDSLSRVVTWFREAFRLNAWALQSDAQDRDGTVTLYAEKNKRPVWVRLHANVGGPGTKDMILFAARDRNGGTAAWLARPRDDLTHQAV